MNIFVYTATKSDRSKVEMDAHVDRFEGCSSVSMTYLFRSEWRYSLPEIKCFPFGIELIFMVSYGLVNQYWRKWDVQLWQFSSSSYCAFNFDCTHFLSLFWSDRSRINSRSISEEKYRKPEYYTSESKDKHEKLTVLWMTVAKAEIKLKIVNSWAYMKD